MLRLVPSLFLIGACLAGCALPPRAGAQPPPQWAGLHSGATASATRVVRQPANWTALWQQLGVEAPRALAPDEMAVAVFAGERRSAGYRLEIVAVRSGRDELVIEYREHRPAPDRSVAQMLTTPWVVTVLPVSDRAVVTRLLPEPARR